MTHEDYSTIKMVKGIYAIAMVESELNPDIVNHSENAAGFLQIRPIMVREANRIVGYKKYTLKDRFSAPKSIEIFLVVQAFHNPELNLKKACFIWNGGTKNLDNDSSKRYFKCTRYYNKVLTKLKSMETLVIESKDRSPEIKFNPNGDLSLSGKSIPEDARKFYKAPLEWVKEYAKAPAIKTTFEIKLDYFNTSSSKCILDLLKEFEYIHRTRRSEVAIIWKYDEDDDDILESGEDYESIIRIPFKFVQMV
jgi:hypothetical protein